MATILVAQGAWSSAWAWKKIAAAAPCRPARPVDPELQNTGLVRARPPSHGGNRHYRPISRTWWPCARPRTLSDVTLIGHSYGGMVCHGHRRPGGEPDRPDRLSRRFRPQGRPEPFEPGRAEGRGQYARRRHARRRWAGAFPPARCRRTPARRTWLGPRAAAHAAAEELRAETGPHRQGPAATPSLYLRHPFRAGRRVLASSAPAQAEPGWKHYELDSSHNPHITCPELCATPAAAHHGRRMSDALRTRS